ncbi:hypothetical protein FQZ97_963550 [compost metagenome]
MPGGFATGAVGGATDQPLRTGLRGAAYGAAIGVVGGDGQLAGGIGGVEHAALGIVGVAGDVADVGARAVHLGEVTHGIVGEGAGEVELAGAAVDHAGLGYVLVGAVVGGGRLEQISFSFSRQD